MKVKYVALKGVCPHCGEEVEICVSKKELKILLKGFVNPEYADAEILRMRSKELKKRGLI